MSIFRDFINSGWIISAMLAYMLLVTFVGYLHAYIAKKNGDDTGERAGMLSWSPWAHIDVVGTISMLFLGIGWGRRVPFDRFRRHDWVATTCIYLSGIVLYCLAGAIAFGVLCKMFGMYAVSELQAFSLRSMSLVNLGQKFPQLHSSLLAFGMILLDIMYLSVVLGVCEVAYNGVGWVVRLLFPHSEINSNSSILFLSLAILFIFFQQIAHYITLVTMITGLLIAHILGAS